MPTTLKKLCLITALLMGMLPGFTPAAEAARGRPSIQDDTLVADNGRLLRGSRWALDIVGTVPNNAYYDDLKNNGLNALHLYAESFAQARCDDLPAGHHLSQIDQIVNTTDSKGLYLIITIGNGSNKHGNGDPDCLTRNGQFDQAYAEGFWDIYAPRYKNRTHVIYEIQNEPYFNGVESHPSPSTVIQFEQALYNRIRGHAPSTPILLFSYAFFLDHTEILGDINSLSGIDWTKTAVAFHGYGPFASIEQTVKEVLKHYPLVQTEFWVDDADPPCPFPCFQEPHIEQTDLYERTRTSWMTFVDMPLIRNSNNWRTPLEDAYILWGADYGTWPGRTTAPVGSTIELEAQGAFSPWNSEWKFVLTHSTTTPLELWSVRSPLASASRFQIVAQPGTFWVALKSELLGRFVSAPNGGLSPLIANRTSAGAAEHFDWLVDRYGYIHLRARANNLFVNSDSSSLTANSSRAVSSTRLRQPGFF